MPGMTGVQLAVRARAFRPTLRMVLMTGYSSDLTPELLATSGVSCLLEKPIDPELLMAAIRE